jgi:hypothetical protein
MCYEKEKPNIIFFSYSQDSEYRQLHVHSWGRHISLQLETCTRKPFKFLNKKKKKKKLLKLCNTKVIPEEYHHWYRSLPSLKNKTDKSPRTTD